MKALHVITGLGIGGAEQQLRLLLRQLPFRNDVVTLTNPGPVAQQLRRDGVHVTHLGMGGNRDLRALPRLTRLIAAGGYDLVHTHLYRACVYGRLAARLARVPSVATEHSLGQHQLEGRPLNRGNRGLYLMTERMGEATVAVSNTVADRLEHWGVPAQRIHVVPNGIDARHFRYSAERRLRARASLGIAEGTYVAGAVGRLVPGKRFDLLLQAAAQADDVHVLLVGDGPERQRLLELAAGLGCAERVHLPGEFTDARTDLSLADLLAAMDVFVSTSQEEAFGLAVLEALAAGLPVLHTTCPALEDLPASFTVGSQAVSGRPGELARELARRRDAGARRIAPPGAVAHYDIARSAALLMNLYEQTLRTSVRS
ncbi:glycosyltransferase [Streptomyces sp. NPDC050418]|uniref:glycosyltransferase n=1 Tax=Streptomyces sp. NPDC050418 TaxID=3365612 RepID=UPI0037ADB4F5